MGLLLKASELDLSKKLAFTDFINSFDLKLCAIFTKKDNIFFIQNSVGFDGISIISSISTLDFWNGICPVLNKTYDFSRSQKNISPLLQFFSFSLTDNINSISIIKITDDSIFMLCNKQISQEMKNQLFYLSDFQQKINFENLLNIQLKNLVAFNYEIDLSESLNSFLQINNCKNNFFFNSIMNEIFNRFFCFYSKGLSVKINENKINVVFLAKDNFSQELVLNHLIFELKQVLDDCSQIIDFSFCKKAKSIIEIKNFLQVV